MCESPSKIFPKSSRDDLKEKATVEKQDGGCPIHFDDNDKVEDNSGGSVSDTPLSFQPSAG